MIHPESAGRFPITFLESLQSTDEQVLKSIYISNYPAVERYIIQHKGTADDARDVYQEAFLAVWRSVQLQRFTPGNKEEYAAYLFQVAKNKWIDQLRTRKHRQLVALGEDEQLEAITNADQEDADTYINAVKKHYGALGDRCRELLKRFYFLKQPLRQIASHFSWTEDSAKNNKYRCLKQLRELVTNKKQ